MIIDDHCEIDEYFNEDIFCDSCHSMWPEMVYIEHWEICRTLNSPQKEQYPCFSIEEEKQKFSVVQNDKTQDKQKRQKRTGRGRRQQMDEPEQIIQKQVKKKAGRTVKTQKKEAVVENIDITTPTFAQRIAQPTRTSERIQCNDCGKQMSMLQFEYHPAYCESPSTRCQFCQESFSTQLITLHRHNCRFNNGSQPQSSPQPQASRPRSSEEENYPMPQITSQFLEYLLSQWNQAKNKDKGLNGSQIQALETVKYEKNGEQEDTCTICQDDIEENSDCIHLPCKHIFHQNCIKQWVKKIALCPNCKYQLKESDPNANK